MNETTQFLVSHGLPLVFAAVFLDQIGLPLPAIPWLLAAGALSATGKLSAFLALGITLLACLLADTLWFYLGRYRGHRVLGLLCRISLEPDSCVRRTQNLYTRYGLRGVVLAKFVPGLSTVAPPLAGMSGVKAGRFLLADGAGSLLYGGCFILLGYLFTNQIQQLAAALAGMAGNAVSLVLGLGIIYIGFKFYQRQRILRELRTARITVAELRQRQEAGEKLTIIDLRPSEELILDPSLIPGAVHLRVDEVEHRHQEIPRDREVVVHCSCPNEVSSARVALLLQRKGITRVRPLLGGIDAWRELKYPLEPLAGQPQPLRAP
ncbi:MAG TPA: DedA family protein/thiosulfate sulfurtransferase GlpE [Dongiaceae bacterium]|nr:DedA family protein/thiosulfate sulfurtransferase GlpE [Dongiaceae bacterium]